MKIVFSEKAENELDSADQSLRKLFLKHSEKIASMPPKRHMKFGLPFNVEEVTKQARMVYYIEEDEGICYVLHCFKTHKEYERWYKSFK
jgi:mRNA-degrading endonuclease RelE of RelBE toxin-antitoxin system